MAAPASYAITLYVNDVDVTNYVEYHSLSHDDYARQVSSLKFKLTAPVGVTPTMYHAVKMVADDLPDTPTVFLGLITHLESTKRDNGIVKEYDITASDYKYYLEKTVLDVGVLSGTDTEIIAALLANAYPDLSSLFDFSSGVDGFASGLSLPTGNKSILDALNDLSDLTGGADFRFDLGIMDNQLLTFDSGVDEIDVVWGSGSGTNPYFQGAISAGSSLPDPELDNGAGNPDDCWRWQLSSGTWDFFPSNGVPLALLRYVASGTNVLNDITFDYYVNSGVVANVEMFILINTPSGNEQDTITSLVGDAWTSVSVAAATGISFPLTLDSGDTIRIQFSPTVQINAASTPIDLRLDNIETSFATPLTGGGDETSNLQWGLDPDPTDFNFDIDSGDEFGFDFHLSEGDFDNYNSITVIGGYSADNVVWIYDNPGTETHFDLELPIEITTIETNTGSDMSPSWTAIDLGILGTDENGVGGIDVLYDTINHWLLFDSAPPTLTLSFRITGTIKIPIRVRVENIEDGDPVLARVYEDESITSVEQAIAIGAAHLNEQKAARHLTFSTFEPGLKPGQQINVTDASRGLNETMTIQRISTKWIGSANALFEVECGEGTIAFADTMIVEADKKNRNLEAGTTTTTYRPLTNDLGEYLYNDNGELLLGD